MRQLKIYNGRFIVPNGIINDGGMLITGSTITTVSEYDIEAPNAVAIDSCGNYISPGFIDIHVHGGGGHDFIDGTKEAFVEVAKLHTRYGTTALTKNYCTFWMCTIKPTRQIRMARHLSGCIWKALILPWASAVRKTAFYTQPKPR